MIFHNKKISAILKNFCGKCPGVRAFFHVWTWFCIGIGIRLLANFLHWHSYQYISSGKNWYSYESSVCIFIGMSLLVKHYPSASFGLTHNWKIHLRMICICGDLIPSHGLFESCKDSIRAWTQLAIPSSSLLNNIEEIHYATPPPMRACEAQLVASLYCTV